MKDFKWYEWAMLVFLILFGTVVALMSPWGQAFVYSEGAPAWIQAVGSVGAIGVAIAVARNQANKQRQLFIDEAEAAENNRKDLRIEAVQGVGFLISTALSGIRTGCGELRRAARLGHRIEYSKGPMVRLRDAVVRVPLHESPYCLFAKEFLACIYRIEEFIVLASQMHGLLSAEERTDQLAKLEEIELAVVELTATLLEKTSSYDGAGAVLNPEVEGRS